MTYVRGENIKHILSFSKTKCKERTEPRRFLESLFLLYFLLLQAFVESPRIIIRIRGWLWWRFFVHLEGCKLRFNDGNLEKKRMRLVKSKLTFSVCANFGPF